MTENKNKKKELDNLVSAAQVALSIEDKKEAYLDYLAAADLCKELAEEVLDKRDASEYSARADEYQAIAHKTLVSMHLSAEEENKIMPRKKPKGFDEFAGMDNIKESFVHDFVEPWNRHDLLSRTRHNLFIYGPEGCAKKVLVQSLIHELGATGYFMSKLNEFSVYTFSNVEGHIKELFKKAEEKDNVVFFIENPEFYFPKEQDEESKLVFEKFYKLFTDEMKSIAKKNLNIFFIAASSDPEKVNPKVFQSKKGLFKKQDAFFDDFVRIHHPNTATRVQIIKERLADRKVVDESVITKMASFSHHFVTKDVSRLCRSVKKMSDLYAVPGEQPVVDDKIVEKVIYDFEPNDDLIFEKSAEIFEKGLPENSYIIHG